MSAKSDPRPALNEPTAVTSEYYYRRPLRAGEWFAAISAGVAIGATVVYVARVALGRTALTSGTDRASSAIGRGSRRPHLRRARNG